VQADPRYETATSVKTQIKFLEELDSLERKRHEEVQRGVLLRAAKVVIVFVQFLVLSGVWYHTHLNSQYKCVIEQEFYICVNGHAAKIRENDFGGIWKIGWLIKKMKVVLV